MSAALVSGGITVADVDAAPSRHNQVVTEPKEGRTPR